MRHPVKKTGQWWLWLMEMSVSKPRLEFLTLTRQIYSHPQRKKLAEMSKIFRFPSPADKTGKSVKRSKLSLEWLYVQYQKWIGTNIVNETGCIVFPILCKGLILVPVRKFPAFQKASLFNRMKYIYCFGTDGLKCNNVLIYSKCGFCS